MPASRLPGFSLRREPGPRLNVPDVLLVGGMFALSWWMLGAAEGFPLWWLPAYGAASFLLFCNLLRVGTAMELPWLAATLATAAAGWWLGWDLAVAVPLAAEPVRWASVWWALRIGWYRGLAWRRLNEAFGHPPEVALGPRPPFRLPWRLTSP